MSDEPKVNFTLLQHAFYLRPTTTRTSRECSKMLQKFLKDNDNGSGGLKDDTPADVIAGWLTEVAHFILKAHYAGSWLPETVQEFESKTTFAEVMGFLILQVAENGPRDFMLQPLSLFLRATTEQPAQVPQA